LLEIENNKIVLLFPDGTPRVFAIEIDGRRMKQLSQKECIQMFRERARGKR
jgi:hypothetical protein